MDFATIIGLISAFGLVIFGILSGGSILLFWNAPSLLIVVGGTLGATLINYPLKDMLSVMGVVKNIFFKKLEAPGTLIKQLVDLGAKSRKGGILSLEPVLKDVRDPYFVKGLQMIIDGLELGSVREVMEKEMEHAGGRHRLGAEIFLTLGTFAPALGMIGTLIGLVQMLQNLDDPSQIGPAMAVALITTFYGALMANIMFLPIAGKLKTRSKEEMLIKELILEGVVSIASGENPRVMEQKLQSFIPPKQREVPPA